jgi:PIN domain nuclease of toxin-antitoxin system
MAAGGFVILLDTCALLWLAEGGKQLSDAARYRIEAARVVYVSAISAFEIGLKYKNGKLRLPVPVAQWFEAIVSHHNLSILPLDAKICIGATELPPIHRDPCDRFIIAAAKALDLAVVTGDPIFSSYGIQVIP